jgi:chromosomal replication initiator protein
MNLSALTLSQIETCAGRCKCGAFDEQPERRSDARIIDGVCAAFQVTPEQLTSRSRKASVVLARHAAMYLLRKHTSHLSFAEISEKFHHTHGSAMYAVQRITEMMETDPAFRALVEGVEAGL